MEFSVHDIDTILVALKSGQQLLYKGGGISRLQRILARDAVKKPIVIDEDLEIEDAVDAVEEKVKRRKKTTGPPVPAYTPGYSNIPLQYEPIKGSSITDIAREYEKSAKATNPHLKY